MSTTVRTRAKATPSESGRIPGEPAAPAFAARWPRSRASPRRPTDSGGPRRAAARGRAAHLRARRRRALFDPPARREGRAVPRLRLLRRRAARATPTSSAPRVGGPSDRPHPRAAAHEAPGDRRQRAPGPAHHQVDGPLLEDPRDHGGPDDLPGRGHRRDLPRRHGRAARLHRRGRGGGLDVRRPRRRRGHARPVARRAARAGRRRRSATSTRCAARASSTSASATSCSRAPRCTSCSRSSPGCSSSRAPCSTPTTRGLATAAPPGTDDGIAPRILESPYIDRPDVRDALVENEGSRAFVVGPLPAAGVLHRHVVAPIMLGEELWGRLVVMEHKTRFTGGDMVAVRRAATLIALQVELRAQGGGGRLERRRLARRRAARRLLEADRGAPPRADRLGVGLDADRAGRVIGSALGRRRPPRPTSGAVAAAFEREAPRAGRPRDRARGPGRGVGRECRRASMRAASPPPNGIASRRSRAAPCAAPSGSIAGVSAVRSGPRRLPGRPPRGAAGRGVHPPLLARRRAGAVHRRRPRRRQPAAVQLRQRGDRRPSPSRRSASWSAKTRRPTC